MPSCEGGKKKPLIQPKKQAKEKDEDDKSFQAETQRGGEETLVAESKGLQEVSPPPITGGTKKSVKKSAVPCA
jgi:hypothetical protein